MGRQGDAGYQTEYSRSLAVLEFGFGGMFFFFFALSVTIIRASVLGFLFQKGLL